MFRVPSKAVAETEFTPESTVPAPRLTVTKKGLFGICHSIGHAYHHGREVLAPFASDTASSTGTK